MSAMIEAYKKGRAARWSGADRDPDCFIYGVDEAVTGRRRNMARDSWCTGWDDESMDRHPAWYTPSL